MSTIIALILVLSIFFIVCAKNKGGNKLIEEKPERIKTFKLEKSINESFLKIVNYANSSKYKVEAVDEVNFRIVLGENMTMTTNGFFFPIYLDKIDENTTQIEVGIKSKSLQVGPLVEKSHQDFVNQLKVALLADISEN